MARISASSAKRQADIAERNLNLELRRNEIDQSLREIDEIDKKINSVRSLQETVNDAIATFDLLIDQTNIESTDKLSKATLETLAQASNAISRIIDNFIESIYEHQEIVGNVEHLGQMTSTRVQYLKFVRAALRAATDSSKIPEVEPNAKEICKWLNELQDSLLDESFRLLETRRYRQIEIETAAHGASVRLPTRYSVPPESA